MIRSKTSFGLSLLSVLAFLILPVGASAVPGTTAFTCVEEGGEVQFADPHCDNYVGLGDYGHVEIPAEKLFVFSGTNEKTSDDTEEAEDARFTAVVAGVEVQITCNVVDVLGLGENIKEGVDKVKATTGAVSVNYEDCTVPKPLKGGKEICKVKQPIEVVADFSTRVGFGPEKNTMGVEVKNNKGGALAEITFEGAECPAKGMTFKLTGTAMGTGSAGSNENVAFSGATLEFTEEMTEGTLKLGGNAASIETTVTLSKFNPETEKEEAITFTTLK